MSGHNKWSSIKHKKGAADAKRSKIFSKLSKEITVAAKMGGTDIDANARLRLAVQNAKGQNMSKEVIQRAIHKAEKDASNFEEHTFEGYAHGGIAIFVECLTDNNNRTVANVRAAFNKCDGNFGTSGSVVFMFDRTCNFRIASNENIDLEELELDLLDFEVEEVFQDEDGIIIYAPFEQFGGVQKYLEDNNHEILSSGFERIPQTMKKLSEEHQADVEKLLQKLEEDDDVQHVYHNMEM